MKKRGNSPHTIKNVSKILTILDKHTDLDKPETVRGYLAQLDRRNGYKRNIAFAYNTYCKHHKLTWNKPKYYQNAKLPKIPTENQIDMLKANASEKLALAISISKETGLRPVETMRLKLRDIDTANRTIYPQTAKHGSARILKITSKTQELLNIYLTHRNIALNDNIFEAWTSETYGKYFRKYRNKLAKKLGDPTLRAIRLYDLRHYFATKLYHQTKDILYVKQQMGHRRLETTLIYTQLLNLNDDEWTCKTATNAEEASQLIEAGFQYITEKDGTMLFRKRK
ncbi:MAG: site-specific integrase [Candidatus Bathyarchaeota archaeon]|nr:site-specific integrase [Candidatus Bathyarchaeota archaeon]MDH5494735.1 site-specific integrase [Candidatus Bathyarchaeota archaeon]